MNIRRYTGRVHRRSRRWRRNPEPLSKKQFKNKIKKLDKLGLTDTRRAQLENDLLHPNVDQTQAMYILDFWEARLASLALAETEDNPALEGRYVDILKRYAGKYNIDIYHCLLDEELQIDYYEALRHFVHLAANNAYFSLPWRPLNRITFKPGRWEEDEFYTWLGLYGGKTKLSGHRYGLRGFPHDDRRRDRAAPAIKLLRGAYAGDPIGMGEHTEIPVELIVSGINLSNPKSETVMAPSDLIEFLTDMENNTVSAKFFAPNVHEPFIKFGDGRSWVIIHRDDKEAEARSMDDCGEGAFSSRSIALLSLREPIPGTDPPQYKALLKAEVVFPTGTIDANEYVSEADLTQPGIVNQLRAHHNSKPDEKLHKYIIPLLEKPWIAHFTRPGHQPNGIFWPSDLTQSQISHLQQKNPQLFNTKQFYEKFKDLGYPGELKEQLLDGLEFPIPYVVQLLSELSSFDIRTSTGEQPTSQKVVESALKKAAEAQESGNLSGELPEIMKAAEYRILGGKRKADGELVTTRPAGERMQKWLMKSGAELSSMEISRVLLTALNSTSKKYPKNWAIAVTSLARKLDRKDNDTKPLLRIATKLIAKGFDLSVGRTGNRIHRTNEERYIIEGISLSLWQIKQSLALLQAKLLMLLDISKEITDLSSKKTKAGIIVNNINKRMKNKFPVIAKQALPTWKVIYSGLQNHWANPPPVAPELPGVPDDEIELQLQNILMLLGASFPDLDGLTIEASGGPGIEWDCPSPPGQQLNPIKSLFEYELKSVPDQEERWRHDWSSDKNEVLITSNILGLEGSDSGQAWDDALPRLNEKLVKIILVDGMSVAEAKEEGIVRGVSASKDTDGGEVSWPVSRLTYYRFRLRDSDNFVVIPVRTNSTLYTTMVVSLSRLLDPPRNAHANLTDFRSKKKRLTEAAQKFLLTTKSPKISKEISKMVELPIDDVIAVLAAKKGSLTVRRNALATIKSRINRGDKHLRVKVLQAIKTLLSKVKSKPFIEEILDVYKEHHSQYELLYFLAAERTDWLSENLEFFVTILKKGLPHTDSNNYELPKGMYDLFRRLMVEDPNNSLAFVIKLLFEIRFTKGSLEGVNALMELALEMILANPSLLITLESDDKIEGTLCRWVKYEAEEFKNTLKLSRKMLKLLTLLRNMTMSLDDLNYSLSYEGIPQLPSPPWPRWGLKGKIRMGKDGEAAKKAMVDARDELIRAFVPGASGGWVLGPQGDTPTQWSMPSIHLSEEVRLLLSDQQDCFLELAIVLAQSMSSADKAKLYSLMEPMVYRMIKGLENSNWGSPNRNSVAMYKKALNRIVRP